MKRSLCFVVLLGILAACVRPVPSITPPAPAATITPLVSPTLSLPPIDATRPAFDPALYRPAMRSEFADDVGGFANAPRYSIDVRVDLDALELTGRERVRYTNTSDSTLREVYFRLFPSTPGFGATMTVTNVSVNGQLAAPHFEQQSTALRVPVALAPNASAEFLLDFVVSIPRDPTAGYAMFGLAEGMVVLPDFYPVIPVHDQSGWHIELAPAYGDETFNPTALYDVTLAAPPGQMVTTSGVCDRPQGSTLHCVSGPMRDFMLAMSNNYQVATQTVDGVTIRSFYLPQHEKGGKRAIKVALDALEVYARRFGPYPYSEFDVVETPTTAGGIEYPGLVVISMFLYPDAESNASFDFVVAHEVAHQWWYSLVGGDQVNHPWLDEALTQYSTMLYYEDTKGAPFAENMARQMFEASYQTLLREGRDQKVDQPVAAFSERDYAAVVYQKGPLFFKALRAAIGDVKFNAFVKLYFNQNRYGIATPERLLAAAESAADKATVRSLYAQWIESATTR